jgi:hypothetical protein
MHERARPKLFFGEHHPNQNNKRFQRDEFIEGKANANHSKHPKIKNNKQIQRAPIITSIKTRMNRMNE